MNRFAPAPKGFTWSYTKLRDYRTCPRKYNETTVLKKYVEPLTPALEDGNHLHEAFKRRVEQNLSMPTAYKNFNDWGNEAAKIIVPGQLTLCEKEIAISREFKETGYFDKNVWLRVKLDLVKIFPHPQGKDKAFAQIIDYKNGKPHEEIIQLALYAQAVFSAFWNVVAVRCEYWWTQIHDKSHELFERGDMDELWRELLPELTKMEQAHKDNNFPPKKNGLCKAHCPVIDCEYNGRQ
jgi:hypothetical protein